MLPFKSWRRKSVRGRYRALILDSGTIILSMGDYENAGRDGLSCVTNQSRGAMKSS